MPEARLALGTAVAVVATIVAVLAAIRFLVEGRADGRAALGRVPRRRARRRSLFDVAPLLDGGRPDRRGDLGLASAPGSSRRR